MNILIVEDNTSMRRLLRSLVGDLAAQVFECGDGAEAIAAYAAHQFDEHDWVLMDIEMKGMDGITATRALRNRWPEAHVVIVTNFDEASLRAAAYEAGACGYVFKENLLELRRLLQSQS